MDMHCKADPFSAMHREYWSPAPSAPSPSFSSLHSSFPNHSSSPDPPPGPSFHRQPLLPWPNPGLRRRSEGRTGPAGLAGGAGVPDSPGPGGAVLRTGGGAGARTPSPGWGGRGLCGAMPGLRAACVPKKIPPEPDLSSAKALSPSPRGQHEFIPTRVSPRAGPFPSPCPAGPGLPATLRGSEPTVFPAI